MPIFRMIEIVSGERVHHVDADSLEEARMKVWDKDNKPKEEHLRTVDVCDDGEVEG